MTINRKLRGIRDPVDPGYILGRPKNMGKGPAVQLKAPPGLLTPQQGVDVQAGLPASGVTAGNYTIASITVNSKGLITAASSGNASLPALNDGQIWIGNGTNVAVARTPSGDVTVSDTGVTAIGANKVLTAMIADGNVTESKIGLSDNTTNNVSTSKHGFAPKGDGNTSLFLNANGAYSAPATGGNGTVTTTGSPASGNLAKFSGTTSITNGDLSGDVSTAGTLVVTIGAGKVTEAMQVLADNTTQNASTSAHGYLKKLDGNATHYMGGDGNWSVPAGNGTSGALTLITSVQPTSGNLTTINSIPGTYRHLKLFISGRLTGSFVVGNVVVRLNNDSGANYDFCQLQTNNTTTTSNTGAAQTGFNYALITGANATAGRAGASEMTLYNYADANDDKCITNLSSAMGNTSATSFFQQNGGGTYRSTSAITRIDIDVSGGGNWTSSGNTVDLYGMS